MLCIFSIVYRLCILVYSYIARTTINKCRLEAARNEPRTGNRLASVQTARPQARPKTPGNPRANICIYIYI